MVLVVVNQYIVSLCVSIDDIKIRNTLYKKGTYSSMCLIDSLNEVLFLCEVP